MKVKDAALLFQQELLEAWEGEELEINFEVTPVQLDGESTSTLVLDFTCSKYTSKLKLYLVQKDEAVKILRSPGWVNQFQIRIAGGVNLAATVEREALVLLAVRWLDASFEKTQRDSGSLQRLKNSALDGVLSTFKRAK